MLARSRGWSYDDSRTPKERAANEAARSRAERIHWGREKDRSVGERPTTTTLRAEWHRTISISEPSVTDVKTPRPWRCPAARSLAK